MIILNIVGALFGIALIGIIISTSLPLIELINLIFYIIFIWYEYLIFFFIFCVI